MATPQKPAARQKVLPIKAPQESRPPAISQVLEAEKSWHDKSKDDVEARIEEIRAEDKIGEVLHHAPFVSCQSPVQVWGVKIKGQVPPYIFGRWYFRASENCIVDTFYGQQEYDAADVEGRRKLAHSMGTRYAALGPKHSRYPIKDPKVKNPLPSMVEQLTQKVK